MATLLEKAKLLRGIHTREVAFAGPFAVTVDATERCNLKCVGCRQHSPILNTGELPNATARDLEPGMFKRLCTALKTMKTRTLVFSGDGEPLFHPRLFEMVSIAKSSGFRIVLITNGTLFDEANARSLLDSPPDLLRVSLWASSPEEYEKNYPGTNRDYFHAVVDGLRRIASIKRERGSDLPRVVLHQVINSSNYRNIDRFIGLALETGCDGVSFSPLHSISGGVSQFGLSGEEENLLKACLLRAKKRLRSSSLSHNIDETIARYHIGEAVRRKVPCYTAWLHPRVKVDGTVQPCNPCNWKMGNLNDSSIREIWNGPEFRSFRRTILARSKTEIIDERCACSFCCYVLENARVHRFYRWFLPLRRLSAE